MNRRIKDSNHLISLFEKAAVRFYSLNESSTVLRRNRLLNDFAYYEEQAQAMFKTNPVGLILLRGIRSYLHALDSDTYPVGYDFNNVVIKGCWPEVTINPNYLKDKLNDITAASTPVTAVKESNVTASWFLEDGTFEIYKARSGADANLNLSILLTLINYKNLNLLQEGLLKVWVARMWNAARAFGTLGELHGKDRELIISRIDAGVACEQALVIKHDGDYYSFLNTHMYSHTALIELKRIVSELELLKSKGFYESGLHILEVLRRFLKPMTAHLQTDDVESRALKDVINAHVKKMKTEVNNVDVKQPRTLAFSVLDSGNNKVDIRLTYISDVQGVVRDSKLKALGQFLAKDLHLLVGSMDKTQQKELDDYLTDAIGYVQKNSMLFSAIKKFGDFPQSGQGLLASTATKEPAMEQPKESIIKEPVKVNAVSSFATIDRAGTTVERVGGMLAEGVSPAAIGLLMTENSPNGKVYTAADVVFLGQFYEDSKLDVLVAVRQAQRLVSEVIESRD